MRTHQPNKCRRRLALALALTLAALIAGVANGVDAGVAGAAAAGSSRPSGVQLIRVSTHGFDWGDAGIGAAAGIGISMLAVGAGLLLTSTRRGIAPPRRLTTKEQR